MNDYIIEPAKTEDYESILELYNELHEVLEECNDDVLGEKEKYWIEYYDARKGLNSKQREKQTYK